MCVIFVYNFYARLKVIGTAITVLFMIYAVFMLLHSFFIFRQVPLDILILKGSGTLIINLFLVADYQSV